MKNSDQDHSKVPYAWEGKNSEKIEFSNVNYWIIIIENII